MTSKRSKLRWNFDRLVCHALRLLWCGLTIATGLDKMQKSTNAYVKAISKRSELEPKEKILPIAHMGGTMITHGSDFESDSEFGQCLSRKEIFLPPLRQD